MIPPYFLIIIYFTVCLWATFYYEKWAKRYAFVDTPNHRSSHTTITVRGAGLVFTASWVLVFLCLPTNIFLKVLLLPGFALNATIGFWDDKKALPAKSKLILQLLTSAYFSTVLLVHFYLISLWWLFPLLILACTAYLNLFNFMDGLDGLAAIHALLFFLPSTLLLRHMPLFNELILPLLLLSVGLVAFLAFNLPPARVFMGDVGSCALGFLIGCLSLIFFLSSLHYFVASILFLGVFLMDSTFTLWRRLLASEKLFEAHKKHAYQRLHQAGYTHGQVLRLNTGLQTLFSLLGLWVAKQQSFMWDGIGLLGMVVVFLIYYSSVEKKKPMYTHCQ